MADENNDAPNVSPLVGWIVTGLVVVILLWASTYAAAEEVRVSLQAAGDAVAVVAAIASVIATVLVLEQIEGPATADEGGAFGSSRRAEPRKTR